jgi:hypothetical protein
MRFWGKLQPDSDRIACGWVVSNAIAVGGNAARHQARPSLKFAATRLRASIGVALRSRRSVPSAVRARSAAQADLALDRVIAALGGNLRAYLLAERLEGGGIAEP